MSAHAQTPSAAKAPIAKSAPPNFDKPDEEKRNPSASLVVDSSPYATSLARGAMKDPISPSERSSSSPCCSTSLARGAIQDPLRRASPANSPFATFAPLLSVRRVMQKPTRRALHASSPYATFAPLLSARGPMHLKPHVAIQTGVPCISYGC